MSARPSPDGVSRAEPGGGDPERMCLDCLKEARRKRLAPSAASAEAWEQFFRVQSPQVRRLVRKFARSRIDLDDRVQDVWLVILTRLHRLDLDPDLGHLDDWLIAVARHALIDWVRSHASHPIERLSPSEEDGLASREPDPAADCQRAEVSGLMEAVLAEVWEWIGERNSQVLYLHWIEGYSFSEIAIRLGAPVIQVRRWHDRAMEKLRRLVKTRHATQHLFEP